jgi:hypothetical protein
MHDDVFFDQKKYKKGAVFTSLFVRSWFVHPILILYSKFAVHSLKILGLYFGGFDEKSGLEDRLKCAVLGKKERLENGRLEKWNGECLTTNTE